jgi:hypothetical protein
MWSRRVLTLVPALAIAAAACTPPSGSPEPRNGDRYVITAAELEKAPELTLYEAVARLRPHFLRSRTISAYGRPETVPVHLYVDGDKMDSLDDLRRLSPGAVQEVRFYEPQKANTVFAGANNAGGAIAVILKSG